MKSQIVAATLVIAGSLIQASAQTPPVVPTRPAAVPVPGRSTPVLPGTGRQIPSTIPTQQTQPPGTTVPGQVTTQSGAVTQPGQVPRTPTQQTGTQPGIQPGTQTAAGGTNFVAPMPGTNQSALNNNETPVGTNVVDRDDLAATNGVSMGTNQVSQTSTNQTGTNNVIQDEGLTAQDRALLIQARRAIRSEVVRDRAPIHLISQNGVITMVGIVPSMTEAQEISALIQRTPGVVSVVNNLQVSNTQITEDEGTSDMDRELVRHVRGHLRQRHTGGEGNMFHVFSSQGVVTLVGVVDSEQQRANLVAAVQNTPGVVQVIDRLRLQGQGVGDNDNDQTAQTLQNGQNTQTAGNPTVVVSNQVGAATSPGAFSNGAGSSGPMTPLITNAPAPTVSNAPSAASAGMSASNAVSASVTNSLLGTNVNPSFPNNSSSAPLRFTNSISR